jgi:ABC-type transport system involved in multi-copper enzyme maturation permease subunit
MTAVRTAPDPSPPPGTRSLATPGPAPLRLIRSELLKIWTTSVWWWFAIGAFLATAAAATVWIIVANLQINAAEEAGDQVFEPSEGTPDEFVEVEREAFELAQDINRTLHDAAAEIYTSGQFFGLMFAMLLGTLLVTNEYHHQTATATFLTVPQRTKVILGKLATAAIGSGLLWVFATVLSIAAGAIFLAIKGYGPQLTAWPVQRAILLNALAYGLWGVLGVGLGVLVRSQIGAVVVGTVTYVLGTLLVQQIILPILYFLLGWEWVVDAMVLWPGIASQIMISPEPILPGAPAWWTGALVLVGFGLLFGVVGTLITRRRDIS